MIGNVGSTGCRRIYKCNACGAIIDTESAKDRPTKHAERACAEHLSIHKKEAAARLIEQEAQPLLEAAKLLDERTRLDARIVEIDARLAAIGVGPAVRP